MNESEALRWVTRQWENWTEKDVISDVYEMLRDFLQEQTFGGRLFQTVVAAVRNPRVPNDKLHRVTDNRLAEADGMDLHGLCWWSKLARYGGLPVFRALKVSVA